MAMRQPDPSDKRDPLGRLKPADSERPTSKPRSATEHPGGPRARKPRPLPTIPGYEVLRELGSGGAGVVYLARHLRLNRWVALKMIRAAQWAADDELQRFYAEAETVAQLSHPNVVQVYEVGDCQGQPFFSLEYMEGGSLRDHLARNPLPARAAAQLMRSLAQAVAFAHQQGVVHRDLKPANVLLKSVPLTDDGDVKSTKVSPEDVLIRAVPKIADFGLAKHMQRSRDLTESGAIMGTPSYMSPEQAAGQTQDVGIRSDVYSLGAILYETLTGRPPFRAATPWETVLQVTSQEPVSPRQLQPSIPVDLETICLKCLEKPIENRYATAGELADDLGRFLDNLPVRARPPLLFERLGKWTRRNPVLSAAVILTVIAIATGAGWIASYRYQRELLHLNQQLDNALGVAKTEKQNADGLRVVVEAALNRVERYRYGNLIALAENAVHSRQLTTAIQRLRECPLGLRDWEWWHLWRQANRLSSVWQCDATIASLVASPNGLWLLSGAEDGEIRLWDRSNAFATHVHVGKASQPIVAVALSADGRTCAAGCVNGSIVVWNKLRSETSQIESSSSNTNNDLKLRHEVHMPGGRVRSISFRPRTDELLVVSGDGVLRLMHTQDGTLTPVTAPLDSVELTALCISPSGTKLAVGDANGTIWITGLSSGSGLTIDSWTAVGKESNPVHRLVWCEDDKKLLSIHEANGSDIVSCWNLNSHQAIWKSSKLKGGSHDILCVPSLRQVAIGSTDGSLLFLDVDSGEELISTFSTFGSTIALTWDPRSKKVLSGGGNQHRGYIAAWQPTPNLVSTSWNTNLSQISDVVDNGSDSRVGIVDTVGNAELWEVGSEPRRVFTAAMREDVALVKLSPDLMHIARGYLDGRLEYSQIVTPQRTANSWKMPYPRWQHLQFTRHGTLIAAVCTDGQNSAIQILDVKTGQLKREQRLVEPTVAFALSPSGKYIAWSTGAGGGYSWQIDETSEPVSHAKLADACLLSYSPNDQYLAVARSTGSLALSSLTTARSTVELANDGDGWQSLAWEVGSRRIAAVNKLGTVELWDVTDGIRVLSWPYPERQVCSVFFGSLNQLTIGDAAGGLVTLWGPPTDRDISPDTAVKAEPQPWEW